MPTIPLYTTPSHADAWHRVCAPGGYEWWYFDADDSENDRHLVAILFDGFAFDPDYANRYARYRRRPTRVAPPVPAEYPAVYFSLWDADKIRCQFTAQFPSGQFIGASDRPEAVVGPDSLTTSNDGSLRLALRGSSFEGRQIKATITFKPRFSHAPNERDLLRYAPATALHRWVIATPLCDVDGTIGVDSESIPFRGRGYHDHRYGTAPLGLGLSHWLRGRVLTDDRAIAFYCARPSDESLADEVHFIEIDAAGMRDTPVSRVITEWKGARAIAGECPGSISFDGAIELTNPRAINVQTNLARAKYDAVVHGERHAVAVCEIGYPQRTSWSIVERLMRRGS